MMINNRKEKSSAVTSRMPVIALTVAVGLALAGCASDEAVPADTAESAPAAENASTGAFSPGAPRFAVPASADQSPPSVNSVPTEAPTPRSTEEERSEARRGLIADLANARHSDQGGRTQPVVVRPYVAATAGDQPAAANAAEPAITERLDAPPPPRPADAAPAKPVPGPAPANRIPGGSL